FSRSGSAALITQVHGPAERLPGHLRHWRWRRRWTNDGSFQLFEGADTRRIAGAGGIAHFVQPHRFVGPLDDTLARGRFHPQRNELADLAGVGEHEENDVPAFVLLERIAFDGVEVKRIGATFGRAEYGELQSGRVHERPHLPLIPQTKDEKDGRFGERKALAGERPNSFLPGAVNIRKS